MTRWFLRGVLLLALLLSLTPPPTTAYAETATTDRVLLLLDVSGSMSDADAKGQIKIEGAKAGISSLLDSLPGSAQVGLMTYPGSGDCGEPKLVRQIQSLTQGNLGATVSSLPTPDGGTPTALALRSAATYLQDGDGNATIVLVSDGLANCGEAPCPVAKEIVQSGISLTVNTVGFDIDDEGRTELECIAEATGGGYADVSDGSQLGKTLADAMAPRLEITPVFPADSVPITSVGAPVTATITNASAVSATNVQVALTPTGSGTLLGVLRPVVSLGNLAKGESRSVSWTVPTATALAGRSVGLKITASAANAVAVSVSDKISFSDPGGSLVSASSQFADVGQVAVLGDSYSAGDGSHQRLEDYRESPRWGHDCRVSAQAYAEVLFPDHVTNFACTGAVTSDVVRGRQHGTIDPQLDQLAASLHRGERYGLVLLTIGGNDIGFGDVAAGCMAHTLLGPASRGLSQLPFLNPCAADPNSVLYGVEQDLVNAQGPILQDTYEQVAMTFSRAGLDVPPIVVSPYPLMVPTDPSLRWSCGLINLGVTMDQMRYFLDFQRQLNRVIEESVSRTREQSGVPVYFAAGVEQSMQPGHTLCGSDPWLVLPRLDNLPMAPLSWDTPFHPNADGYQAWAIRLARWAESPGLSLQRGTKPAGKRTLPWVFTLAPRGHIVADGSTDVVAAGDADLTVTGLAPGSPLIAVIHSNPYPLGYAVADESGTAHLQVHIDPAIVPAGLHELQLGVLQPDGTQVVRTSRLYVTRQIPYVVWASALLGAAAVLTGLVLRRRQRRRRPS